MKTIPQIIESLLCRGLHNKKDNILFKTSCIYSFSSSVDSFIVKQSDSWIMRKSIFRWVLIP